MASHNSFNTRTRLTAGGASFDIFSLPALEKAGYGGVARLPYSLKILLENLLRREDGRFVDPDDIKALAGWDVTGKTQKEIAFTPARVLLQDFTGVPAVVDLAAMRDGIVRLGGDPKKVNPLQPVELVIDHSVQVDYYAERNASDLNAALEFTRNRERYTFLRWGQEAFHNFRVVPPDTGIVHQINVEYLARVVFKEQADGVTLAYPDTLVGTDSHTTMVNGLGVVGWGVGGIEAEAAMLGQPISMLIPEVIGFRLVDRLPEGATATDLVLTITERLRKFGVVGKFVEFYGPGLEFLTIADRATLGNMSPEYGATIAICPIDEMTLDYLRLTGREESHVNLVEAYAKEQGLFRRADAPEPVYTATLELDLSTVEPSLAGPKRPQDRVSLRQAKYKFQQALDGMMAERKLKPVPVVKPGETSAPAAVAAASAVGVADLTMSVPGMEGLGHGSVVVAAITSCTNTSNPSVMIAAGLLARNAVTRGLKVKPWVKTSLAPGSLVVTEYLKAAGLLEYLAELGFNIVGYGCTTCIGNSGPLPEPISSIVKEQNLVVASVLSGNRNFEGRIQSQVRANYLASPPLVVAYALAGHMQIDMTSEPLGKGTSGESIYLKDIWPAEREIQETMLKAVKSEMFREKYATVFDGDDRWRALPSPTGERFDWDGSSTYIRNPPFFEGLTLEPAVPTDIGGARVLALLGDSVTTDHISPAGSIPTDSPAGRYLVSQHVAPSDFNSYGARRGNHEVMMRGTFANIRLRNQIAPGTEGGWTTLLPQGEVTTIFDASVRYREAGVPLLIIAGKEYGSGSSRDWAAKGTMLLGVKAVLAESFERIHRSNLVNMGVLPLQFNDGCTAASLKLTGRETYDIIGMGTSCTPRGAITVRATDADGTVKEFTVTTRIDTPEELVAFRHGGILPYVLRQLVRPDQTGTGC
ncbi:MAG: aconitate hydratase 1 [Acidobacteria bacterium RIFCSPLOWO2_02_FULL_67_36]|nr:MAG: aconitate hydratase 1 [Acidobacteria bacterium RIFCSPLOWO2_02_FULL_67_36]OFW23435.1 MAG: aconitate hydratase 1 [Acidobacteria bacterium RIFCSPLOWO2_12_FULL_66_21]